RQAVKRMAPRSASTRKPQNRVWVNSTFELPARSPLFGSACSRPTGRPEFGKSCECASLPCTISLVDALKRGLQVVRVMRSAKAFLITDVSLGDTTQVLVVS